MDDPHENDERRSADRRLADRLAGDHDILVRLCTDVEHLEEQVGRLVTRLEFAPVKIVVYGLVGLLLSGIIAAILTLVISVKMGA